MMMEDPELLSIAEMLAEESPIDSIEIKGDEIYDGQD